jgi:hypothetical protein
VARRLPAGQGDGDFQVTVGVSDGSVEVRSPSMAVDLGPSSLMLGGGEASENPFTRVLPRTSYVHNGKTSVFARRITVETHMCPESVRRRHLCL